MTTPRHWPAALSWHIRPAWRQRLAEGQQLPLSRWLAEGRGQVVKSGVHRTVYRVDAPAGQLFVKHYRCPQWWKALTHLFRGSASRREWRHAREIERRAVPTVLPVALGEQRWAGVVRDSVLVTEAIVPSTSLAAYLDDLLPRLDPPEAARRRRALIIALARLCACAHAAGVDHNDLHIGNVLVGHGDWERPASQLHTSKLLASQQPASQQPASNEPCSNEPCSNEPASNEPSSPQPASPQPASSVEPPLYLLDLPGVRLRRPLGWRHTRNSLAMLAGGVLQRTSTRDRLRFWRAYLRARTDLPIGCPHRRTARQRGAQIHEQAQQRIRRVMASRDVRALGTNRDFYRLVAPHGRAHAVVDVPRAVLEQFAREPDRALARGVDRPLKLGHRSVVVETTCPLVDGPVPAVLKRERPRGGLKSLLAPLRRPRALRAWRMGHALLVRGIATPRPLAVCRTTAGRRSGETYLWTTRVVGALNLHLYAWRLAHEPAHQRRARTTQAAAAVGELVGRMHAWQIAHGDLKGCNLAFVEQEAAVDALLLDVDAAVVHCRLPSRARMHDLARLAVSLERHPWISRGDRLRFLRAYLAQQDPTPGNWRALWKAVERRARPLRRRLLRDGGPIA